MGKKKKVAKKDKAVFRLVHRSQHDPLAGEGSQRVLVPVNDNAMRQYDEIYQDQVDQEEKDGGPPLETDEDLFEGDEDMQEGGKGKEKEIPTGVSLADYDRHDFEYGHLGMGGDGYDYSQHMRSTGTGDVFIPAPKPRAYKKPLVGKNDTVNFLKEDKEKEKVLPTALFPSVMQGDTKLLHLQNFDSKPFLDKDILHYLEEDVASDASEMEEFEEGELEDDFITLAEAEGGEGEEGDYVAPKRKPASGFVPDPEDCYDDDDEDENFSDDDGPPELEEYEEKQRMDPVVMNERQKDLEEQFQNVLEMYDEDDIGELDPEDPRLQGKKDIDQFQNVLDEHIETTGRQIRFGLGALDEEEGEDAKKQLAARLLSLNLPNDTVRMAVENGAAMGQQWDCQSITSLYSNTENHPSVIKETQQIKLSHKTGIPLGYLGKHMNKKKALEEEEEEEEEEDDEDDDSDEEDKVNWGEKRPKKESAEDKRARKQAAKKAKQEARVRKKETKQEYSREKSRQMSAQSADTFRQQAQIHM